MQWTLTCLPCQLVVKIGKLEFERAVRPVQQQDGVIQAKNQAARVELVPHGGDLAKIEKLGANEAGVDDGSVKIKRDCSITNP